MRRLVFFHGAGGFDEDRFLAGGLGAVLGRPVEMPRLPDEDTSFEAWATIVRRTLAALDARTGADAGDQDLLVGHSFGASILLRVIGEGANITGRVVLLAMPDWSPTGWDVADYAFTGAEPGLPISLHHCRDDDVVPFAHLARHAIALPTARVGEYPTGGHQFHGRIEAIAADAIGTW